MPMNLIVVIFECGNADHHHDHQILIHGNIYHLDHEIEDCEKLLGS